MKRRQREYDYKCEYYYIRYTDELTERASVFKFNDMLDAIKAARERNESNKASGNLPIIWYVVRHSIREEWSESKTHKINREEKYEIVAKVNERNSVEV